MNGYKGTVYPGPQSERNALFKPLVAATIRQVLGRDDVASTVHGRNGDVKKNTLPPVEIRFIEGPLVAETFIKDGSKMSKERKPGVSHLYFNSYTTLATR